MTKKEAIKHHRAMWITLAETGNQDKKTCQEIQNFPNLCNTCFLCEYDYERASQHGCLYSCLFCPLEWPDGHCVGEDGELYTEWSSETDIEKRKEFARQIANLPERK